MRLFSLSVVPEIAKLTKRYGERDEHHPIPFFFFKSKKKKEKKKEEEKNKDLRVGRDRGSRYYKIFEHY